jgi:hypothetical protein
VPSREMNCPFCTPDTARILLESDAAIALRDGFAVSDGHSLVLPRHHVASLFDLPEEEQAMAAGGSGRRLLRSIPPGSSPRKGMRPRMAGGGNVLNAFRHQRTGHVGRGRVITLLSPQCSFHACAARKANSLSPDTNPWR